MSGRNDSELVRVLAVAVRQMLVCPTCSNGRGVTRLSGELGECPTCQGEHPNKYLIARLDDALIRAGE